MAVGLSKKKSLVTSEDWPPQKSGCFPFFSINQFLTPSAHPNSRDLLLKDITPPKKTQNPQKTQKTINPKPKTKNTKKNPKTIALVNGQDELSALESYASASGLLIHHIVFWLGMMVLGSCEGGFAVFLE